jgi:hypothetical protein
MLKKLLITAAASASLLCFSQSAQAQDEQKEYFVKAAFLYNFAKFAEWPPEHKAATGVKLCIAGGNPFGAAGAVFNEAAKKGQPFTMLDEAAWQADPGQCHILYIGRGESARVPQLLEGVAGKSVLTVSDTDDFINKGGSIGFVAKDNKIRLAINMKNTARQQLRIDAQLLEIAVTVIRN